MMSDRRLPPLNAVRAFETAARHSTFAAAGDELGVSPGAVAQHVKALEAWLGLPLFRRLPSRGVVLTPAGERYAAAVGDLLDGLADATRRLRRGQNANILTVSTVPSFAAHWLIPRLGDLRRTLPQLDIRVVAAAGLSNFARDDVDVAIRLGRGPYPGLRADVLFRGVFVAVCSPALIAGGVALDRPADLARHVLLHEEEDPGIPGQIGWKHWLAASGVTEVDADRGPRFTHTFMVIQAAISGQGVAVVPLEFVDEALATGQLVRPFALTVPSTYTYFVVSPEATADDPKVATFRCWILDAFRARDRRGFAGIAGDSDAPASPDPGRS